MFLDWSNNIMQIFIIHSKGSCENCVYVQFCPLKIYATRRLSSLLFRVSNCLILCIKVLCHMIVWPLTWSFQLSPPVRVSKAHDRLHQHQAQSPKTHFLSSSPKSSPMHKKCRSEVKKCRKVYGMENRELWCTQCKWKKACSRFLDWKCIISVTDL